MVTQLLSVPGWSCGADGCLLQGVMTIVEDGGLCSIYNGEWENNEAHGRGIFTSSAGDM